MICGSLSPGRAAAAHTAQTLEEMRALAPEPGRTFELSRQHVIAGAALLVAIVAIGWFGLQTQSNRPRLTDVASNVTPVTAFPTTTTTPAQRIPLDKILVNPPYDFQPTGVAGEKNGPIGLADFDDASDHQMMATAQFTGGYEHVWQRQGAPDVILKAVFEVADDQHATDLFTTMTRGEQLLPGNEIPGAVIGTARCSCMSVGQAVAFRKGSRIFLVSVGTTEGRFTEAETSALAVEQYKAS